jgi:Haem-binding domain
MVKNILKIIAIAVFIGFVAIQFIRPEKINPEIEQKNTLNASTNVPENVRLIFKRSCNDCHSHETVFPFYSNIAPISWKVVEHINDGRKHLNFSIWNTYEANKKKRKLEEICEEMQSGEMPMSEYTLIHRDAILSAEDIKIVCDWTIIEVEKFRQTEVK